MNRKGRLSRRTALEMAAGLFSLSVTEGLVAAQESPAATLRRTRELAWQPLKSEFFPPGLEIKPLFEDSSKNFSLSLVRYPKGYKEPRHTHKTCGHWLYFLRGRLRDPETVYEPGTYVYAPPGNVHGPFTADEETEVLFFVDGAFDVYGA